MFAHNGVLTCVEPTVAMSDTRMFNKVFLKNMQPNFLGSKKVREFIGEIINTDKMVFQTTNPVLNKNTYIINENLGITENGIWFSNSSYKSRNLVTNYAYDNLTCDYNWDDGYVYSGTDYVSIIEQHGSIADYLSSSNDDPSLFDDFDEIVEQANKVPNQIVMHTFDNDNLNIFSTSKNYDISPFVNDEIKYLLSEATEPFGLFQNLNDMTVSDLNKLTWDVFGYGLPTLIKSKVKV